jgi:ABC-2 type transport system permease protein
VVFNAIGVFASSLSENQIVSFMLAVFLCFLMYEGFTSLAALELWGNYRYAVSQIGVDFHYRSISRGLIDTRNLTYFLSLGLLMLGLTRLVLASRQW